MSGQKRILMLLDNPLKSDQRVEKEARSLTRAGFDVTIVASSEDPALPEEETIDGVRIVRWLSPFFKHPLRRGYSAALAAAADRIQELEISIIHCHDFALLPLAVELKSRHPGSFLTYDSHEYLKGWPYYREIPSLWNRAKGYFVWKRFLKQERAAASMLNAIVCPSKGIATALKAQLETSLDPLVIRNIPEPYSSDVDHTLRNRLGLGDADLLLVHSGNIHASDQDIERLIDGVERSEACHLLFIGNRPRHEVLRSRFEGRPRIHFETYDDEKLPAQLRACDIGVAMTETRYLAHRIGSSNRIMEYTLAGLPILATDQPSHAELKAAHGHLELFDPSDAQSIENGMLNLIEDMKSRRVKAHQASTAHSWEREMRPLLTLYERVSDG